MEKKMTKVQKFGEVLVAVQGGQSAMSTADMVAFLEKEIALLNGKAERKASKKSDANADLKMTVINVLSTFSTPATVTEVLGASGLAISNQKMTSVLKSLVEAGIVANTKDKKNSHYSLISERVEDSTEE